LIKQDCGKVVCSIWDDGLGFDVSAVLGRGESGVGLFGIQDRLEAVNGLFEIISAPGKGTELRGTIPLET
jgi:two-component system sensor histidine kinase DegS